MNRVIPIAAIALVAVMMGMSAFAPAMADKPGEEPNEGKVLVCHIPPGNPDKAHTISISEDDVADHLEHGDFEGDCDGD